MQDVRGFLERVLPWPAPEEGYIGIFTHLPGGPFKGVAVQSVDAFLQELDRAREKEENIYFCLSQQREAKPNGRGLIAIRNQLNATALKAIWIDLDVGPDKPYATTKEAFEAFAKFLDAAKLPGPTAIVASGSGGAHIYWASDRPLSPGMWRLYAEGLHALAERHGLGIDAKCTIDSARVLRVPETLNFKHSPPRPVKLLGMKKVYDFAADLQVLLTAAPAPAKGSSPSRSQGPLPKIPARFANSKALIVVKDEDLPEGFPPMPAKELRACLDLIPNDKPDWDRWNTIGMRVYAACDGADYGQEEWQRWSDQVALKVETDSCESRWNTYHTSPPTRTGAGALVNEVRRITGNDRWLPAKPPPPSTPPDDKNPFNLPEGFELEDGFIYGWFETKKGERYREKIFLDKVVRTPWAQAEPEKGVHLCIETDVARTFDAFIPHTDYASTKIINALYGQNISRNPKVSAAQLEDFMVSWAKKMNNYAAAKSNSPFGWEWEAESKYPSAFTYGGTRFANDGTKHPVGAIDDKMRREYYPTGSKDAWFEASKLVFGQNRPELEIIVAAALAGPLMIFTGESGAMLSVYSTDSGAHKSTASMLGAAIWGHPRNSRESTGSSWKGAVKRAGDVRHLTIQWDDIQEEKDLATVSQTAFQLSQGYGGTKLNSDRTYHETGSWQTLLCSFSNKSFVDYIVKKEPNNAAKLNRVFEIRHSKRPWDNTGMIDETIALRLLGNLDRNYGLLGLEVAELLANNAEAFDALVQSEMDSFRAAIAAEGIEQDSSNRFWFCVCTIILAGAKLGLELGIPFNYEAIRARLVEAFKDNCERRTEEEVEGETQRNTENAMAAFLKRACAGHSCWTTRSAKRGGYEDKVKLLQGPERGRELMVHFVTLEREIRISQRQFGIALGEHGISASVVKRGLVKFFAADTQHKYILAAGTEFAGMSEKTIVIPVPEGSIFEEVLFAHGGKIDDQI